MPKIKKSLKDELYDTIAQGLKRKSVSSCSRWAEMYRIMKGNEPWRFDRFPWLRDMHDSKAELNVGQKAAQMGFTEALLNINFYHIDIAAVDCLYVLPAKTPDASDFSAARFDAALELSPHLRNLFSDVKNIGHKRAGAINLYIRGSRSRSGLKSVPVGLISLDELDEMTQENIPLALERTSGQIVKLAWMISTPTLEGTGINQYFQDSSQGHYFFKCPSCSKHIELVFPDSVVIADENNLKASHYICTECKNTIEHENKVNIFKTAKWVDKYERDIKGWHVPQLYSTAIKPEHLVRSYYRSFHDKTEEQEFYNSKLGLPHEVEGARITDSQIEKAKGTYKRHSESHNGLVTMGVDVGHPWLHYNIDRWSIQKDIRDTTDLNAMARPQTLTFGKIREFEELDELMKTFNVNFCVIDAHPERRKAFEFASRFWKRVRLCIYATGITGKQMHLDSVDPLVSVDRTSWLDLSLGRFRSETTTIPYDIDNEYRNHLRALVRVYVKDKNGNPVGRYENGKDADHYAHARNYSEVALPLALSLGKSQNISGVF